MSEIDPNEHEDIARRLRDDGPVQAPSDLAGEVMKRVRSEPRRSTSAVRRPLVTLLAASLVTVALVAGIAKLGGGAASSAGGSSGGGAESPRSGGASIVETKDVESVPKAALGKLTAFGPATHSNALLAACPGGLSDARQSFSLAVPYNAWDSVQAQLQSAKLLPFKPPLVTVHLHRLAPGVTTRGAITCP